MPSIAQVQSIGDGTATYISSFSPVAGGYYDTGVLYNDGSYGRWWGSEAYAGAQRYILGYNGSNLYTSGSLRRRGGLYVRCVQKSAPSS